MCGIVGVSFLRSQPDSIPTERYEQAMEALRHRGPDANGQYRDSKVWLAHRRLSIIDLSAAANQPMLTPDRRFAMTYNGEVYNFRDLARTHGLQNLRSNSDTEVVMQLFAKIGTEAFCQLNGMFAFAVYDSGEQKLWLVRDRLGIKPLYYQLDADRLVFASEIKSIVSLTRETLTCDFAGLNEWLYYGTPLGERTLYRGIQQLLPGHFLEIDLESFERRICPYWTLEQQASRRVNGSNVPTDTIGETRRLLEQAVERQLVGDVPVGVFLSGGIDSSAIVAFASRHYNKRLVTYSAGFDFSPDGGELAKAKHVAGIFGTDHHEVHISGEDAGDLIEEMVRHHDMPFSDAANIPLYLLASRISADTKVVLQGDGGDELFGGYRRYSTLSYYRFLHWAARGMQCLNIGPSMSKRHQRVRRYVNAFAAEDIGTTMALLLTMEDRESAPASIFAPAIRDAVERSDPFARFKECSRLFADQDTCNRMSLVDMMIVLPDTYLEKVDRSTMAASLEVRVPFLDHDLLDFVVNIPGRQKIPWGRKKWLLKQALDGIVPAEILHGPKHGLTVPFGQWLQGPLRPMFFDCLAEFDRSNPDVLDTSVIRQMFNRTKNGVQNHAPMLWKLLNLMVWATISKIDFSPGNSVH